MSWRSWRARNASRARHKQPFSCSIRMKLGSRRMMRAVLALARGRQRAGGSFADLSKGKTSEVMGHLLTEAARIAGEDDGVQDRVAAIRLIGLADAKTARGLFPTLLDAREPIAIQLAVFRALADRI